MEFKWFKDDMIAEAAVLLAKRHSAEREIHPALPAKFTEQKYAERAIEGLKEKGPVIGIASFENSKMTGYMIAITLNEPQRGRHAWIDYAGFALKGGTDPELIRILYSKLGEKLASLGYFSHFVLAPNGDSRVLDAWFRLCFAHEQVHGFLDLAKVEGVALEPGSHIRLADKSDEHAVREMYNFIPIQVASAPVWGATLPETLPDLNDGYAELLDDPHVRFWGAFLEDGSIASSVATWPDRASDTEMKIPKDCISVSCVATRHEFRGKGLNGKLLAVAMADARERGFKYCETDWLMANLAISNFLPKKGFIPYAFRLHRRIDERILWASGKNGPD